MFLLTNVTYSYADACKSIFNTIKTSGHSSLEKYTSHFIWKGSKGLRKVLSVRGELETEQNCNILTRTLLAIAAFLSHSPVLLNGGPRGPASAGTWFSLQHLSPTDLNFLSPGLYNNLTHTYFLRASHLYSIQPVDSQGAPLISSTGCTCYLHRCISHLTARSGRRSICYTNILWNVYLFIILYPVM